MLAFCRMVRPRLLLLLAFSSALSASSAFAQPATPPPGRLVDVGGWRLHLNCTGEARRGAPTVILKAGGGADSNAWLIVQPKVALFARVC